MRLPSGFRFGCGLRAPWRGYVVFLCGGVHNAQPGPHAHPATTGTIEPWPASAPEPQGDFCGGTVERPTRKSYVMT